MPPDRDFDRELRDLGPRVEYPPTPDIARSVRSRLETEAGGSGSSPRARPQLWWIVAAALVLLVSVPVFSLAVRNTGGGGAAGDAANVEAGSEEQAVGERPERVNGLKTGPVSEAQGDDAASSGASAGAGAMAIQDGSGGAGAARGGASGEDLGLGEKIPLREARARAQAPLLLPASPRLGEPDEVYVREGNRGLVLVYNARPRMRTLDDTDVSLILTQVPGDVGAAYLPEGSVGGAGLEKVGVGGGEGYWIPPQGDAPEVARSGGLLAGVLLWEQDGRALRLEAEVPKQRAVRLAESVR